MASKVASVATKSGLKWVWPSIACASIGAVTWSNFTHQSSLQHFESEIAKLRQLLDVQQQSLNQQQNKISSLQRAAPSPASIGSSSLSDDSKAMATDSYSKIAKEVSPSIVNLVIEGESTVNMGFFQIQQPVTMLGSGVIVRQDGVIATNNHVVTSPSYANQAQHPSIPQYQTNASNPDHTITVYFSNKRKMTARVILRDELNDLALLKIESDDDEIFPFIDIGDASTMEVGDRVLAVGNNLGLQNTVTDGIISAIGRAQASSQIQLQNEQQQYGQLQQNQGVIRIGKNPYLPFLQTNAAINQGSSGGALIDVESRTLIGINTAIISPIGVNIGLGFAIPSNYVKSLLRSLDAPYIYENKVVRPWDGMDVMPRENDRKKDGNDLSFPYSNGVKIAGLHSQSPAMESGVMVGDILTEMDHRVQIGSQDQYWMALEGFVPGQTVPYSVLRWNEESSEYEKLTFDVKIGNPPSPTTQNAKRKNARDVFGHCTFGELQPSLGIEWGFNPSKEGVMLMEVPWESYAARSGLLAGDLLLEIDGVKVENLDQINDLNVNRSDRHQLVIQRGDMIGEFTV